MIDGFSQPAAHPADTVGRDSVDDALGPFSLLSRNGHYVSAGIEPIDGSVDQRAGHGENPPDVTVGLEFLRDCETMAGLLGEQTENDVIGHGESRLVVVASLNATSHDQHANE